MNMNKEVLVLNLKDVLPNRFQPRIVFDEKAISELAESIKEHGVIQPIVVRKIADKYEIIAGERRYKASLLAGKTTIPAIITDLNDKDSAEIALIENIQRSDLTPIEEAISYKKILDMGYLNQADLALKLGKTQSTVANKLRLLNLSEEVQEELLKGHISERHARSLLKLSKEEQEKMVKRIIQERMTVRKTDEEIDKLLHPEENKPQENVQKKIEEKPMKKIVKFNLEDDEEEETNDMNNNEIMGNFNIPTTPIVEENHENINISNDKQSFNNVNGETSDQNFTDVSPITSVEEIPPFNSNIEIKQNPMFNNMDMNNNQNDAMSQQSSPTMLDSSNTAVFNSSPIAENINNPTISNVDPTNPEPITGGKFFNMFSESDEQTGTNNTNSETSGTEPKPFYSNNIEETSFDTTNNFNSVSNPIPNDSFEQSSNPKSTVEINSNVENINPFAQFTNTTVDSSPNNIESPSELKSVSNEPVPISSITPTPITEEVNNEPVNMTPLQTYRLNDDQVFENSSVVELGTFGNGRMEEAVLQPLRMEDNTKPKASMKDVINLIRDCEKAIENYGYVVDSDEMDFEDSYQVTFKIMKEDI